MESNSVMFFYLLHVFVSFVLFQSPLYLVIFNSLELQNSIVPKKIILYIIYIYRDLKINFSFNIKIELQGFQKKKQLSVIY